MAAENPGGNKKNRGARVWVLREGRPQEVQVTTGLSDDTHVEITGGALKEGDQVIVNEIASSSTSGSAQRTTRLHF